MNDASVRCLCGGGGWWLRRFLPSGPRFKCFTDIYWASMPNFISNYRIYKRREQLLQLVKTLQEPFISSGVSWGRHSRRFQKHTAYQNCMQVVQCFSFQSTLLNVGDRYRSVLTYFICGHEILKKFIRFKTFATSTACPLLCGTHTKLLQPSVHLYVWKISRTAERVFKKMNIRKPY
jgi:hypothetical protein